MSTLKQLALLCAGLVLYVICWGLFLLLFALPWNIFQWP